MTITPRRGRWRVTTKTNAGHIVLLADKLDESEAQEMYDECSAALLHGSQYGFENSNHVLAGQLGTVRLDAVEAVQIAEDRTVTGR